MRKILQKSCLVAAAGVLVGMAPGIAQAMLVTDYPYETDLADKFVDWGISGRYDVNADQTDDEMWVPHAVGSTTTLIFAENQVSGQEFGLYNRAGTKAAIFSGTQTVPTPVAATWWGDDLIINGVTYTDFGKPFGFYFDSGLTASTYTEDIIYTEAKRNRNGQDFFASYRGDGGTIDFDEDGVADHFGVDDWIIAADWTHHIDGGYDADDFVVFVSEMQPVPEPATLLLIGTGLVGLAGVSRRRKSA